MRLSPWDGVTEFLMVVETGAFSRAAKRLGVSTSHVSRQVARLEDRLGTKLLARSTRVVRLTEAGSAYHAKVSDLAAGIDEANQAAAGESAQLAGLVRISAAGTFAEERVAPVIAQFAAENPRLSIEMDFNTRNVDLVDQGFDFAVRYGVLADSSMIARRLSGREMVCAASPEFLQTHGTPAHYSELGDYDCLLTNQERWMFRDSDTGKSASIRVLGRWAANNGHALRHAAVAGLGIAYSPIENLNPALERGELVRILEEFVDDSRSSWIVYPERRHMPLRVRRTIDHLLDKFSH